MSNKNKISQDDKDWLNIIADKPVENPDPETLQEARFLREALLRKHYEETLEPQPITLGDELSLRFQKEVSLPPPPPPFFWEGIIQKTKKTWEQLLENPLPAFATACLLMILHIPLYLGIGQQNANHLTPTSKEENPVLVARALDGPYKDSRSHRVPLSELEEFVFQLHILGVGTQVTPQAGERWLLQFKLDLEKLDEARLKTFAKFLQSKDQPLPPFDSTLEVELLFLPLRQGEAIETYPYLLSNAPPDIKTAETLAKHIEQTFQGLGVKAKITPQQGQFYIDLWFPDKLTVDIEQAMDEYGEMNRILLKPNFRRFRILIK